MYFIEESSELRQQIPVSVWLLKTSVWKKPVRVFLWQTRYMWAGNNNSTFYRVGVSSMSAADKSES